MNRYEKIFSFGQELIHIGVFTFFDNKVNYSGGLYSLVSDNNNSNILRCSTAPNVSDNTWKHVVFVCSTTNNKHQLLVNDVFIAEISLNSNWMAFDNFIMGVTNISYCGNYYSGTRLVGFLDDLRIYNRALSDTK